MGCFNTDLGFQHQNGRVASSVPHVPVPGRGGGRGPCRLRPKGAWARPGCLGSQHVSQPPLHVFTLSVRTHIPCKQQWIGENPLEKPSKRLIWEAGPWRFHYRGSNQWKRTHRWSTWYTPIMSDKKVREIEHFKGLMVQPRLAVQLSL